MTQHREGFDHGPIALSVPSPRYAQQETQAAYLFAERVPPALARAAHGLNMRCEAVADGDGGLGRYDVIIAPIGGGQVAKRLNRLDEIDDGSAILILDCALDAVDAAWDRFADHPRARILIQPQEGDWLAALSALPGALAGRSHDNVADGRLAQLDRLQEEVNRIARIIARMHEGDRASLFAPDGSREPPSPFIEDQLREGGRGYRGAGDGQPNGPAITARQVRKLIRLRRAREQFFSAELFADPAWDMMLDLYAARLERNRVAVSSLCIAAAVPATTALRWIKSLTAAGLFERQDDLHDKRRIFVTLSDGALSAMHNYFAAITDEGAVI